MRARPTIIAEIVDRAAVARPHRFSQSFMWTGRALCGVLNSRAQEVDLMKKDSKLRLVFDAATNARSAVESVDARSTGHGLLEEILGQGVIVGDAGELIARLRAKAWTSSSQVAVRGRASL